MHGLDESACRARLSALMALATAPAFAATLTTGNEEQSLPPYWQVEDDGMRLRLVQRRPDPTRGFFMARRSSPARAVHIASSCVFQIVLKNPHARIHAEAADVTSA